MILILLTQLKCTNKYPTEKILCIRHWILFISSYIFYGWWDWRFCFLMLGLTLVAYICALWHTQTGKKLPIYIGCIVPLAILGIFKYFNFFLDSFINLFHLSSPGTLNIILPVGISFYTFQSLSYSIDVYRGRIPAEKSFLKLGLYIAFFPQLVAGPIVKANVFLPQLYEDRKVTWNSFTQGIQIFLFGLCKKIVIADHLSVCVDEVFSSPAHYHGISILFAVIAYSIQIYFDFSGYSDMAIGCAKSFGYDLQRNFNLPYLAKNVSEFWKRWHISLSSWLMEYLYIPLGGNRRGKRRTYINLFLTMLIGGLWHGASWTFVVWGIMHGLALCIHKQWRVLLRKDKSDQGTLPGNILSTILTYAFVCLCWVFFRAPNFEIACSVIKGIVTWQPGILYISSWTVIGIVLVVIAFLIAIFKSAKAKKITEGFYPIMDLNTVSGLTVFFVVLGLALILAYTGNSPFIYFQF